MPDGTTRFFTDRVDVPNWDGDTFGYSVAMLDAAHTYALVDQLDVTYSFTGTASPLVGTATPQSFALHNGTEVYDITNMTSAERTQLATQLITELVSEQYVEPGQGLMTTLDTATLNAEAHSSQLPIHAVGQVLDTTSAQVIKHSYDYQGASGRYFSEPGMFNVTMNNRTVSFNYQVIVPNFDGDRYGWKLQLLDRDNQDAAIDEVLALWDFHGSGSPLDGIAVPRSITTNHGTKEIDVSTLSETLRNHALEKAIEDLVSALPARSELRAEKDVLREYFDQRTGASFKAVVVTAEDVAAETISDEHRVRPEVFEALLDVIVPAVAQEVGINPVDLRRDVDQSIADLQMLLVQKRIVLDGQGTAIMTTTGDVDQRINMMMAALPIFVALAKRDRTGEYQQSIVLAGVNAEAIKQAVYVKGIDQLNDQERALVGKIVKFASGKIGFDDLIRQEIFKQHNRPAPHAVASSLTEAETAAMPEIIQQILNAVEDPSDLNWKPASLVQKAEAYVIRALLLSDLASRLRIEAEKLKGQPDYRAKVGVYIRKYFEQNLPDIAVRFNDDGSFRLTLADISRQLSVFKAAAAAQAKSA
ncbi:MAG: hypothetical protein PHS88_12675 [Candidatus Omnitrophica bacterium]|nr:hypothetical protein [Candidatus Omnitrophota bacterium]